ncbi:hypothetical protein [Aurantiacibacter flavus]|uniref:DUF4760 domain-containing protein n=1 Tax=Aurantiacibacter flavus TaxID=3145232 RepID=A0ABV0CTB5_9SPHN
MSEPSPNVWLSLAPLALSVIGWVVVFEHSALLKNRDNISEIVKSAKFEVDEILKISKQYYESNDNHIGFLSGEIRSKFLLVSHYLMLLRDLGVDGKVARYLVQYKQAVTGGYFETIDFKMQTQEQVGKSDITNSANELKFRIDKMYCDWMKSTSILKVISSLFRDRIRNLRD